MRSVRPQIAPLLGDAGDSQLPHAFLRRHPDSFGEGGKGEGQIGQLLDPQGHNRAQQQAAAEQQKPAIRLIEIGPEDKGFVRFFKTMLRGGQLLFIALMGFFIWLVTAIAS